MSAEIPSWKERQKLLHSHVQKSDPTKLSELGRRCLGKGLVQDAFEYLRAAHDQDGLERLRAFAEEEGDAFLYEAIEKCLSPHSIDQWNQLGNRAFDLGKYRFAQRAFERTQNELMLVKVRAALGIPGASQSL